MQDRTNFKAHPILRLQSFRINGRNVIPAVLIVCVIVLIVMYQTKDRKTYFDPYLEDVLLSDAKPTPGRTIFFHETRSHPPQLMNLTARQACAIESAALHNPNFQVFVLFTSPTNLPESNPVIDALLSYKNVHLRQLNLWQYTKDTPAEAWMKKGELFHSKFIIHHTSDLLRLISLYRFGGIYLDMDVVVLRSLEDVPLNYVGTETSESFGNGVISLEPDGRGHEIGELFLSDYVQNYNGEYFTQNGPILMARVLTKICGTSNFTAMWEDSKLCKGFKVFSPTAFYAIPYPAWRLFFEPQHLEEVLAKTDHSYLVHFWNKLSSEQPLKVGSGAAYAKYAEQHCPKAYAVAGEYF